MSGAGGWRTLHVSFILKLDECIALILLPSGLVRGSFIFEIVDDDADLGTMSVKCPNPSWAGQLLSGLM